MALLVIDVTVVDPETGNVGMGSAAVFVADPPGELLAPEVAPANRYHQLGAQLPDFAERSRQIWGQVR